MSTQPRLNIKSSVATTGGLRRRHAASAVGKERRDSLLRAKRVCRDSADVDVPLVEPPGGSTAAVEGAVEVVRTALSRYGTEPTGTPHVVEALRALRKLLSGAGEVPLGAALSAGAVPVLTECCGFGAPEDQLVEAAWCLANLASEETLPASALLIAHLGGVGGRSAGAVVEKCAWAVANFAAEASPATVDVLLSQGALLALARVLLANSGPADSPSLARVSAWALSNVVKGGDARVAQELVTVAGMPEAIVGLLGGDVDVNIAAEVAWLLVYVAAKSDAAMDVLLTAGAAPALVALLASSDDVALLTPVVRTLGNVSAGDDMWTDAVLAGGEGIVPGGTISLLTRCLRTPNRALQKESLWVMANIAGGRWKHKQSVLETAGADLLDALVKGSFDVRKEAAFALGNACGPHPPHGVDVGALEYVVGGGCIPPLIALLRSPDADAAFMSLQFLEMILRSLPGKRGPAVVEEHEGVEAFEGLQFHENEELRRMANHVMDTYFGMEEEYGPVG